MDDHGAALLGARFEPGIAGVTLGEIGLGRVDVVDIAEPVEASGEGRDARDRAVVMQHDGGSTDDAKVMILVDVASSTGAILFETSSGLRRMHDDAVVGGYIARMELLGGGDVAFARRLVKAVVPDERTIGMQDVLVRLEMQVEVLLECAEAESNRWL